MNTESVPKVTEAERAAVETALWAKLGRPVWGKAGDSPYSEEGVVYILEEHRVRGTRVAIQGVCRSHNGAGHYKGRGRRRVVFVATASSGEHAVSAICDCGDRGAEEVGASGLFVRPFYIHEEERATLGMGVAGSSALADALRAVGLTGE